MFDHITLPQKVAQELPRQVQPANGENIILPVRNGFALPIRSNTPPGTRIPEKVEPLLPESTTVHVAILDLTKKDDKAEYEKILTGVCNGILTVIKKDVHFTSMKDCRVYIEYRYKELVLDVNSNRALSEVMDIMNRIQ